MKIDKSLPYKNLVGRPGRAIALILLTSLLSLTLFAGTLVIKSLRTGLFSLESRLGADLMIVPEEAYEQSQIENIVLNGSIGEFYMDSEKTAEIAKLAGIQEMSSQFFLASANSGCCSVPVQIIGYDPETDFSVSPWIKRSLAKEPQDMDVIIGSSLNAYVGDSLYFYGKECHVAAKLEKTGTSFDTAVFTNSNTIKELMRSAINRNMNKFGDVDPDKVVSCLMVNVDKAHTAQQIRLDINKNIEGVKAVQTRDLIAGVSESLGGAADLIGGLSAAIWILGIGILILSFNLSVNGRIKEFALLRMIGVSRKRLASIIMEETLIIGIVGAVIGSLTGLFVLVQFGTLIENKLGLPFLLPGTWNLVLLAIIAISVTVLSEVLSAAYSTLRISRIDTAYILRGGN